MLLGSLIWNNPTHTRQLPAVRDPASGWPSVGPRWAGVIQVTSLITFIGFVEAVNHDRKGGCLIATIENGVICFKSSMAAWEIIDELFEEFFFCKLINLC